MTAMLVENTRSLTEFEPCDKCGNRSYFIATSGDFELTFCAHHGMQYSETLESQGFLVDDQTHLLANDL